MQIEYLTPNREILRELGARFARIRKQQGYSQTHLAKDAGIGVATLRRLEAGHDTQMATWLKLMKSLQMIAAIDALLPETYRSPMAEALPIKKPRQKQNSSSSIWGDEER